MLKRQTRQSKDSGREKAVEEREREVEEPCPVDAIVVSSDEEELGPSHGHENGFNSIRIKEWDPEKVSDTWKKHRGRKRKRVFLEQVAAHTPSGVPIKWKSLALLRGCQWLDDELVNGYFELIRRRSCCGCRVDTKGLRQVEVFSTFWWTKISVNGTGFDYAGVKRWMHTADLLKKDMILIPINHSNLHWTLASIDLREGRIDYFDSMNGHGLSGQAGKRVLKTLKKFVKKLSHEDKCCQYPRHFAKRVVKQIPGQMDPGSCGVFTCLYGERLSRGMLPPFDFEQKDIPRLRNCMAADILQAKIHYSTC